jgi:hypothetical protein
VYLTSPATFIDRDADGHVVVDDCNDNDYSLALEQEYYQDHDLDGLGNPAVSIVVCSNVAPDGYVTNNTDNNDESEIIITPSDPVNITTVSGSTAGNILLTYSDKTTAHVNIYPKYTGQKKTKVKYLPKRDLYLVIHPKGKAVAALTVSDDSSSVRVIDTMKLSTKGYQSVKVQAIKRKIAGKKAQAFILYTKNKARVILVKFNKTGKTNVFLKKTAHTVLQLQHKKKILVGKKQANGYPVHIATTAGVVKFHLLPKAWRLK